MHSLIIRHIKLLHGRIKSRPNLRNILSNSGWLLIDSLLRLGLGLFVGVWLTRYLGPEKFGILNFALAFVGLFGTIASLGLQSIVVREIVNKPYSSPEILGSAGGMQLVAGLATYFLILISIFCISPDNTILRSTVALVGVTLVFKSGEISAWWFESQVQSRYTVWAQNITVLVFCLLKVLFVWQGLPLICFAWLVMAESVFLSFMLLSFMDRFGGPKLVELRFSSTRAYNLLKDSWTLILSGVAISVFTRVDQLMLGRMVGYDSVGIYSAAVKLSEFWFIIIPALMGSIFPTLVKLHENKSADLPKRWIQAYGLMFWISAIVAILLTAFSGRIVQFVYGSNYLEAAPVLTIYAWSGINVALGSVWSKWLLLENKIGIGFYAYLFCALINVALNLLLIPNHGPAGAAFATLASYWISALASYCLHKPKKTFFYIVNGITFGRFAHG